MHMKNTKNKIGTRILEHFQNILYIDELVSKKTSSVFSLKILIFFSLK